MLNSNNHSVFFFLNISNTILVLVASLFCTNGIHKKSRMAWNMNPKKFRKGGIHDNRKSPSVHANPANTNPLL